MEEGEEEPYSIKGIDFNFENKESCNKLLKAVMQGEEKRVRRLLKSDWSPNSTDNLGRTAVHLAARSSSLYNILRLLLNEGGFPDHVTHTGASPICLAAYEGLEKHVSLLLDHGASLTLRSHIEATVLHFACNGPSLEAVKLLVEAGAEVNVVDVFNITPLMLAAKNKSHDIVKYLLNQGADILIKDSKERTVFHYACNNDDVEMINILLTMYPEPSHLGDLVDSGGWTLLMFAAQWGSARITERLLELGSDASKTNMQGLMAIHLAAHNSLPCFESLLRVTPIDKINSLCVFSKEPLTNSLPCLLIDKFELEGLKLLFNKPGISSDVLTCPIVKRNRIFPPVPFSFFSESTPDFASSVIQLYIEKGLPLDPEYPAPSQTVTCLESLTTAHIFHSDPGHNNMCKCAELFVVLLKNGATPDPYSLPEDLQTNSVLWFVCLRGSTFGLSYIFRYSNFLEPHHALKSVTNLLIDPKILDLSSFTKVTIEFLCKISVPWEVSKCRKLVTSMSPTLPHLKNAIASYPHGDIDIPSLKFLCRAALREHGHSLSHLAPECESSYSRKAGKAFRQFLLNLPLPKSLLSYVMYDDIFNLFTCPHGYPSFNI